MYYNQYFVAEDSNIDTECGNNVVQNPLLCWFISSSTVGLMVHMSIFFYKFIYRIIWIYMVDISWSFFIADISIFNYINLVDINPSSMNGAYSPTNIHLQGTVGAPANFSRFSDGFSTVDPTTVAMSRCKLFGVRFWKSPANSSTRSLGPHLWCVVLLDVSIGIEEPHVAGADTCVGRVGVQVSG